MVVPWWFHTATSVPRARHLPFSLLRMLIQLACLARAGGHCSSQASGFGRPGRSFARFLLPQLRPNILLGFGPPKTIDHFQILFLENRGSQETPILEEIQAGAFALPAPKGGDYTLHFADGSSEKITDFQPREVQLSSGITLNLGWSEAVPRTASSSTWPRPRVAAYFSPSGVLPLVWVLRQSHDDLDATVFAGKGRRCGGDSGKVVRRGAGA